MGGITVNYGRTKDPRLISQAKKLRQEGQSITEIAEVTGLKRTLISEVTRDYYNPRPVKTCEFCGDDFVANALKQRYCCPHHSCLALQYRQKGWDYSTYPRVANNRYTEAQILEAMALRKAGMPLYNVTAKTGIPATTLRRRGVGHFTWTKTCPACGVVFESPTTHQKYCDDHKQRSWRARKLSDKVLESGVDNSVQT